MTKSPEKRTPEADCAHARINRMMGLDEENLRAHVKKKALAQLRDTTAILFLLYAALAVVRFTYQLMAGQSELAGWAVAGLVAFGAWSLHQAIKSDGR